MEKVLKIKSNLDKLNSNALDNWTSLESNVKKVLDEVFKEGADLGYKATVGLELGESGFVDTKTSLIMTLFRAWMQAENAGGVISR